MTSVEQVELCGLASLRERWRRYPGMVVFKQRRKVAKKSEARDRQTARTFDRTATFPLNSRFSLSGEIHGERICRRELINRTTAAARKSTASGPGWRQRTAGPS